MRLATKQIRATSLLMAATVVMLASFVTAGVALADTTTCAKQATIAAGDYNIQTNEWNSGLRQCITTSGTAWSVTTADFNLAANGAPATYPSIYKGCHWGNCTSNSGLPVRVSKLTSATTSWSTTQVIAGAYDVAYDLWFNSTPTTLGQPDGTEVMIWLNSRGGVEPGAFRPADGAGGRGLDVDGNYLDDGEPLAGARGGVLDGPLL